MAKFAVRTVKDGKVKINGRYYAPKEGSPDPAPLEGHRFAFGRYFTGNEPSRGRDGKTFVCLWGSEAYYRLTDPEDYEKGDFGPHIVNGYYLYEWWDEIDSSS